MNLPSIANLTKAQKIVIGAAALVVLLLILILSGILPGLRQPQGGGEDVKLTVWGVFEDQQTLQASVGGFDFSYTGFNVETYETELVNALASDRGPDIFLIHNTWLPKHVDRLVPIGPETLPLAQLREFFPTVVEQDFAPDNGLIYALPLSIDTLALIYNKDFYDSAGITFPPKTWDEFVRQVPLLRRLDSSGAVVRAAAAIGGSAASINRATDLVNAMMLGRGVPMTNNTFTAATFARDGLDVLNLYVSFANPNPASEVYTWNERLPYSLDGFAEESIASIFNYAYQLKFLKEKNPFLPIAVAPLPQFTRALRDVNYANYWGFAVSRKSKNSAAAWRLIIALTTNLANARRYLEATGRPPALRALIQEKLNDPAIGVFVKQALSARSWPQVDNNLVEERFSKMVADVLSGKSTKTAIEEAEAAITARMSARQP